MQDIETLIVELEARMQRDCQLLRQWRHFHRLTGVFLNLFLIAAPAILAVGIASSEEPSGKILLVLITIVGGLNATFRPWTHSYRRRSDMNALLRLRDEFRAEIAGLRILEDQATAIDTYRKYSQLYADIYEIRGKDLVEAMLSVAELRDNAENDDLKEPAPSAGRAQPVQGVTSSTP